VTYEGAGLTDKRYLHADERGSIIAVSNGSGTVTAINSYDDYGIPKSTNPAGMGRFGYTGQAWLPEIGLSYYKARIYSPTLGRFLQADPIGYADGVNLYAYVGGDPINRRDPSGLEEEDAEIVVSGTRLAKPKEVAPLVSGGAALFGSFFNNSSGLGKGADRGESMGDGAESDGTEEEAKPLCPPPSNVSFSGTIYTLPVGPAYFSGTLSDVSTGRTYSVSGYGYGVGLIAGSYSVEGTVKGFSGLSNGLDIRFAQGPYGSGSASLTDNNGRSVGQGSVTSKIAPPVGAGAISIDPPRVNLVKRGKC
jgi:RHS repeat-associated protein